ncbi:hypothetical protein ACSTD9_21665 [Vibrio vulnificus]|uniref:hypothetical protein n=1 Tax=Vibrio vulnificus TaxID=672 RepID=UPI003EDB6641
MNFLLGITISHLLAWQRTTNLTYYDKRNPNLLLNLAAKCDELKTSNSFIRLRKSKHLCASGTFNQPTPCSNEATHEHWHEKKRKKRDDWDRPSRFADIRKRMVGDTPKSFSQQLCFSLRKPNAQLRGEARNTDFTALRFNTEIDA